MAHRSKSSNQTTQAYPRPHLVRENWTGLNGEWEFAMDPDAEWTRPEQVDFDQTIRVPFAPETPMSGVEETGFFKAVWYRRSIRAPKMQNGQRLLLHFGAVDYQASVWINGKLAVTHEGGYTPFFADITDLLQEGEQRIVVRAFDDPHDLAKPRGKQDWQLRPHSIWYQRTTGVWQGVWMEVVPSSWISKLRWTPNVERWEMGLDAFIAGALQEDLKLRVRLASRNRVLADDTYGVIEGHVARKIVFSDPGIGDYRNELLWTPERPNLIDVELELLDREGAVIDKISSYTAMRGVALLGNRFVLNGHPVYLRLVLDQGYWEESGLTAPDDEAIRRDVELVKAMGFNGVRKHQKIEDPRFLYWADKLGIFVWEEMPSPYQFSHVAVARLTRQWIEAIERDVSHPCIIAWTPFNESWGVPDLPDSPAQRNCVQAIYHLTKTLDPTRPVVGNDGWEAAATDIVGIHDYAAKPRTLVERYAVRDERFASLLRNERPAGRMLILEGFNYAGQPIMLTEFGGIAYSKDAAHTWGYSRAQSEQDLADRYFALLEAVRGIGLFAGYCYTQFTDTYQEANGLLYMDRTPKFPLDQMALATRGDRNPREEAATEQWRARIAKGRGRKPQQTRA